MSTVLQNKLLRYEMPPPEGNWEAIAARLNNEFSSQDLQTSQKIESIELPPPTAIWQNITAALDEKTTVQPSAKIVSLNWKRWAVAAAITGIVGVVAWLYMSQKPAIEIANTSSETVAPEQKKDTGNGMVVNPTTPAVLPVSPELKTPVKERQSLSNTLAIADRRKPHDIHSSATVSQNIITTVDITETAAVTAPLLRDSKGNVIMDMSLLTTGSSNYISVTGPNGEQTRISTKFANYLMYLNKDSDDQEEYIDYLIRNSNFWKSRFEQWRTRILQQASFIPSSSNFFDILELKELLKDN